MRRHVLVLWDDDPIHTHTLSDVRPVRVGNGANADVVLPIEPLEIANDGDTRVGHFLVRVTTIEESLPAAPFVIDRSIGYTALSAGIHIFAISIFLVGTLAFPSNAGADEATRLAAMKGYLARIEDRGDAQLPSRPIRRGGDVDVDDSIENEDTTPIAQSPAFSSESLHAPIATTKAKMSGKPAVAIKTNDGANSFVADFSDTHASTGAAGGGASGVNGAGAIALRKGDDWSGTYTCSQGLTDVVLHVDAVTGDDMRGVFDFTHSPTGVHGSYRLHGHVDHESGEAILVPDEWIDRPGNYVTVGMHGTWKDKKFNGYITNASCGTFNLRHT